MKTIQKLPLALLLTMSACGMVSSKIEDPLKPLPNASFKACSWTGQNAREFVDALKKYMPTQDAIHYGPFSFNVIQSLLSGSPLRYDYYFQMSTGDSVTEVSDAVNAEIVYKIAAKQDFTNMGASGVGVFMIGEVSCIDSGGINVSCQALQNNCSGPTKNP